MQEDEGLEKYSRKLEDQLIIFTVINFQPFIASYMPFLIIYIHYCNLNIDLPYLLSIHYFPFSVAIVLIYWQICCYKITYIYCPTK